MLALLTLSANQRVSTDALARAAWGDHVSAGAASTLLSHIWRLRQLLEPERDPRQGATVLVNDNGGYRLVAGPSTVDSLQFGTASSEVRDLLTTGHASSAVRRADSALALWRGRPYGQFADEEWAQAAVARLDEMRAQLQEQRLSGLLATNAVDTVLADLQQAIATTPYRESLRAVQMEALYRSGRTEEALQAFQLARRTLLDDVGIEPGPALQQLHQRILGNDPTLLHRSFESSPTRPVEVHLPPSLSPLVGRDDVLDPVARLVREHRLVTLTGAAGCGKTRVAVEVARRVAASFADGVWFVDLTAVTDPELVVDVVVSTIGFASSTGATPLQDLRQYLQDRRLLLVLDNCEHVLGAVEQIARVTLGDASDAPECCLFTTSREPIDVDSEVVWTLDTLTLPSAGADPKTSPAVQLFLQRLAAAAPALTVDDKVLLRAADICVAVDGLPLAVELAAARAHSHSLADIAAQVVEDPGRLSRVGRGARDHRATVRSAIEWSHRLLRADEQRAHRRLSVLPGAFTTNPAAAVVGDTPSVDVDDLLSRLVHRSLVASDGIAEPGRATKFRQLATVRSHARHALVDEDETRLCLDRRDAWTASLIARRPPLGTSAETVWYHAVDDDYATVRATLARTLLDEPCAQGGRLASQLTYYWYYRERLVEATRWLTLGHAVLQQTAPDDALTAGLWLASVHTIQGRLDLARPLIDGIDSVICSLPRNRLVPVGEALVGVATAAYNNAAPDVLANLNRLLKRLAGQSGDPNLTLLADAVDCCALLTAGNLDTAVELATAVQARAETADHPMAGWVSTAPLIAGALRAQRPADGIPWVERCLALHLRLGTGAIGLFTETRANFAAQMGDYVHAARLYGAARAETRRAAMVWPNRTWTPPLLAKTQNALSQADYQQAWQEGEMQRAADLARMHRPNSVCGVLIVVIG